MIEILLIVVPFSVAGIIALMYIASILSDIRTDIAKTKLSHERIARSLESIAQSMEMKG